MRVLPPKNATARGGLYTPRKGKEQSRLCLFNEMIHLIPETVLSLDIRERLCQAIVAQGTSIPEELSLPIMQRLAHLSKEDDVETIGSHPRFFRVKPDNLGDLSLSLNRLS